MRESAPSKTVRANRVSSFLPVTKQTQAESPVEHNSLRPLRLARNWNSPMTTTTPVNDFDLSCAVSELREAFKKVERARLQRRTIPAKTDAAIIRAMEALTTAIAIGNAEHVPPCDDAVGVKPKRKR